MVGAVRPADDYIDSNTAQAQESTCLASGFAMLVGMTAKTPLIEKCHHMLIM